MHRVPVLQIIAERGRAKGAVALAHQKLRRIPAIVAIDVGVDVLAERIHVFVDAVEIRRLSLADDVTVAGAHRVNEHHVGLVEEAFGVIHELVRRRRGKLAVGVVATRRGPNAPMCSHIEAEPGPPL